MVLDSVKQSVADSVKCCIVYRGSFSFTRLSYHINLLFSPHCDTVCARETLVSVSVLMDWTLLGEVMRWSGTGHIYSPC